MDNSTQGKINLKQLQKKSNEMLNQLILKFPQNLDDLSVDNIKKYNAINSTIRLIQAQQRLDDRKKLALVSVVSSVVCSGAFSLLFAKLFL